MVLAAADARIGDRHAQHGLVPAAGGSVRLTQTMPRALANYLLLSGALLDGTQAAALGLVTEATEPGRLDETAERVIERLRSRSADSLATVKRMISLPRSRSFPNSFEAELDLFLGHAATSADARTGIAVFREKRTPAFGRGGLDGCETTPTNESERRT